MNVVANANLVGITGIARRLVLDGALDEGAAREALDKATAERKPVAAWLREKKLVTAAQLAAANSIEFGMPVFDPATMEGEHNAIKLVSEELLRKHSLLPLYKRGSKLFVGTADPTDTRALDEVKFNANLSVEPILVAEDTLKRTLELWLEATDSFGDALEDAEGLENLDVGGDESSDSGSDVNGDDTPIVKFVNKVLVDAIKKGASDIHFEPYETDYRVRLRIDGILKQVARMPVKLNQRITARLKVMAQLDIAEKRLPQDGRIGLRLVGRAVDVRVSTLPSGHGERVVLRLLDKQAGRLELRHLGMCDEHYQAMERVISRPHGIVLVTGPTGSGKTTTLYSALMRLNDRSRNILTVEDPIEYYLDGIGQTQVNTKVDMTFARGLRAILRQDPDVVMVGEIRDQETADMAVQASLTGHLVLSTLHTNSAIGAVTRLVDMGVEPFLISSSLLGVLAQRLVRVLCNDCKRAYVADEAECALFGIDPSEAPTLYHAEGCDVCRQLGYRGRTGIYELVLFDDSLRSMIHTRVAEQEMIRHARELGPSIRADGLRKVLEGVTTIEEVLRVTSDDRRSGQGDRRQGGDRRGTARDRRATDR